MDEIVRPIKIVISGKLSYEDEITLNQAAQIIAFIDSSTGGNAGMMPAAATRLAPAQIANPRGAAAANPREALEAAGARTNPEKILTFAGSILDEGKDTFTLDDIRPLFRRAREATPKNLNRDFDVVVRNGWADEADISGEYYITAKGAAALKEGFTKSKSARKPNSSPKSGGTRRPRKPAEVPEAFKDVDPIPSSLDGIPDFVRLTGRKDQFLWVLKLAKTLGLDGLTNREVVWITDYLGAGIATNNVNSAFTTARRSNHVNRSTQTGKIRITPQGEQALAALAAPKAES
ncbi:hypothetical protein [uncultured Jatrophihabitans sp.]|uniref:hypothetical protein n=1 Tax=uncultured Jatrophihabitans sp. TaxID=1610747 RepID=UPI0035C98CF8